MNEPPDRGPPAPADLLREALRQGQRPDVRRLLGDVGPVESAEILETLRIDQAWRWPRGEPVRVEEYLSYPGAERLAPEEILDLIYGEFVLRAQQPASAPTFDEYLQRFPQHAPGLRRQFELHQAISPASGAPSQGPTRAAPGEGCPEWIGKYRVIQEVSGGMGGQATVYRAVHPALHRDVAIKLSHEAVPPDSPERDRLLQEGRILADLHHPNLAQVHDLDFHEDRAFLVLEYLRGRTLEQLARQKRLPPAEAAWLVAQAARALGAAHQRGIIHQDVKPQNILIGEDGRPRVLDFGLARRQHAWAEDALPPDSIWGTVPFMPPEQARAEAAAIGPASDVFGLGGVLYFLLTGRAPFQGKDVLDSLMRARECRWDRDALRTAGVPRPLRAACERALAETPAARYARAEDFARDLERFARRRAWRRWLAGAALVVALAAAAWWALTPSAPRAQGRLTVSEIEREGRGHPLVPADAEELAEHTPLQADDRLTLRCDLPRGFHPVAFCVNSDGQLHELEAFVTQEEAGDRARFPSAKAWRVEGPEGTVLFLLCAARGGRPDPREVKAALEQAGLVGKALPRLPPQTVLLVHRDAVETVVPRGSKVRDPFETRFAHVRDRLDRLRIQLKGRFDYFAAAALPQD